MRSFKITVLWESSGHEEVWKCNYSPEHPHVETADDFYSLLKDAEGQNIENMSPEAKDYIIEIYGPVCYADNAPGILLSIEEL